MSGNGDRDSLNITLGVEEELFLVDPDTLDLLADPDKGIFEVCRKNRGPHKVVPEFLRSQVEINTRVCRSVADVREALQETRRLVIQAAESHGVRAVAVSTHPFGAWDAQVVTRGERYASLAATYQQSLRQLLTGGMHIHAGFGDGDSRIRVMTAIRRHLPLLLALSGSSPFSSGRLTGFKSHRLNIFAGLPRTGIPSALGSRSEFDAIVANYRRMEFIFDGADLWWDIRPSAKYGTVEVRICNVCTRLDDAVAIVALYATLLRHFLRLDSEGRLPEEPPTEIIEANRWLAIRYGVFAFFGDPAKAGRIDIDEYARALVEDLRDGVAGSAGHHSRRCRG